MLKTGYRTIKAQGAITEMGLGSSSPSLAQEPLSVKVCLVPTSKVSLAFSGLLLP